MCMVRSIDIGIETCIQTDMIHGGLSVSAEIAARGL